MNHMNHSEWIETLYEGAKPSTAARLAGISPSTVLRQVERGALSADNVIALARHFDKDIVSALVHTGRVRREEIRVQDPELALPYATNLALHNEMMKRVDPEARRMFHGGEEAVANIITPDFGDFDLPPGAAADGSPDHPEEDDPL